MREGTGAITVHKVEAVLWDCDKRALIEAKTERRVTPGQKPDPKKPNTRSTSAQAESEADRLDTRKLIQQTDPIRSSKRIPTQPILTGHQLQTRVKTAKKPRDNQGCRR